MDYISLSDIHDEVLKCTDDDITVGNDTIDREARRLGVTATVPVSLVVKRLGVSAACYNRCLMKTGTDPTAVFDGANAAENVDVYAQKLKLYRAEMDHIIDSLTTEDFGSDGGRGRYAIPLYRS